MKNFTEWIIIGILLAIVLVLYVFDSKNPKGFKPIKVLIRTGMLILAAVMLFMAFDAFFAKGKVFSLVLNRTEFVEDDYLVESVSDNRVNNILQKDNQEIFVELTQDAEKYDPQSIFVIVKEKDISYQDMNFIDISEFEEYLRTTITPEDELYIVDVYADSAVMHSVLDIVDIYHSNYTMEYK